MHRLRGDDDASSKKRTDPGPHRLS